MSEGGPAGTDDAQSTEEPTADDPPAAADATDTSPPMTDDTHPEAADGSNRLLDDPDEARRYLMWAAVALLALLAVVATFQVYTGASRAIGQFVAPDYRPLFRAAFNLAVLLLAVAGITRLLRQLQAAS